MVETKKVLLDTDIGSDIDDALALLLLLHLSDVELVGVTTVYGKVDLRARIARRILQLAGSRVPVVIGEGMPMRPAFPVWHTGLEGVGLLSEADLSASHQTLDISQDAPAFIVEHVLRYPNEITLIAIGALTNVARAFETQPDIAHLLDRLVFMGAGITYADPVPARIVAGEIYESQRSHNIGCDVEAARRVFSSGIPIQVLTNDVTTRVWWAGDAVQELLDVRDPPEAFAVAGLLKVWLEYRSDIFGQPVSGTCPHDPLTVAEAVLPGEFVDYAQGRIMIKDDGSTRFAAEIDGPHQVGKTVDAEPFLAWFSPRLMQKP